MFYGCSSLEKINVSGFNTENVKYMNGMFLGCSSLKELNISHFNFSNVIDISSMFFKCSDELEKKVKNQVRKIYCKAFV